MSENLDNVRYGVVYFDPKGGIDGQGSFDWSFCKNVSLSEAEDTALTWNRVCGLGEKCRSVYAVGVAPWRGYDIEIESLDIEAALSWNHLWIEKQLTSSHFLNARFELENSQLNREVLPDATVLDSRLQNSD